jgi:hypothetical protein
MAQKPMLRAEVYARALRASKNVERAEPWMNTSLLELYKFSRKKDAQGKYEASRHKAKRQHLREAQLEKTETAKHCPRG